MGEAPAVTYDADWQAIGPRAIRERTAHNRIMTLPAAALETTGFTEGTDVAMFARGGEILLTRWDDGIPEAVALPSHADEPGVGEGHYVTAGVRELHTSSETHLLTITRRAMDVANVTADVHLQMWATEGALKLTVDGPDVE